jgi:acetyl esterase/lipase
MKLHIFLLAALLAWPGWAQDAPSKAVPSREIVSKCYVYKHSGGKPRELEVFFPPNHQPSHAKVPAVVLFHGGAWVGGHRAMLRPVCQYLASRGLVTVTVDYQMLSKKEAAALPPPASFKRVCITDAKSAIRWVKEHAPELGIDPQKIITGGGSAGGHIALLATTNPGLNDPADQTNTSVEVKAYLLFNPALKLNEKSDPEVDALKHVGPGLAPAFVTFGTEDTWKPGWDVLWQKLMAQGNTTTEIWLAEGQPHGFFNKEPWKTLTFLQLDRFLSKQGLIQGEPKIIPPATGAKLIRAE